MTQGAKTSEAIGAAVSTLLAGGYGLTQDDPMVQAASIAGVCFVWGAYAIGRGLRKAGKQ